MVLNFLKTTIPPLAIDFGYSELKVLQTAPGEPGEIVAAARAKIPDAVRSNVAVRHEYLSEELPRLLRDGGFEGRVAVCSIPTWQTFVQHMRVPKIENSDLKEQLVDQLQAMIACDPTNVVIHHVKVCDVADGDTMSTEVICFAVARDVVMRQIDLLRRCKLETGGLYAEPVAANQAFRRLYRRQGDDRITTAYIDAGASCVKVMVAHGHQLVFAKSIPFGGRHFDQRIAEALHCDVSDASRHRQTFIRDHAVPSLREESGVSSGMSPSTDAGAALVGGQSAEGAQPDTQMEGHAMAIAGERRRGRMPQELSTMSPGGGHQNPSKSDPATLEGPQATVCECLQEMHGHLVEEVQMCARYHASLFPGRDIDRLFLMGGESRGLDLCLSLGEALQVPTYLADPLKRFQVSNEVKLVGLSDVENQFGWAVVAGLGACPAEL